ncbi:MAG: amylo-alpha-1,6-glucosidase [Candidatus Delongbacteria bacterium]|nr:amylo-alpha-1,6-glucosidase [Candidatus Delongbacteria bacterium]MCG2761376.1 amylo-alpha-1,6-glucosidase [Candidatus Delongbacteria bacterium]
MDYNYYYNEVMHHEWVISNKKGGYSLGCGNLVNKRKYNGLLIAADDKLKRTHIVQAQEEKVKWRSKEIFLDSNNYFECIFPDGYEHIVKTWLLPYPAVLYSSIPKSDDFLIIKEIKMHPTKNIVKISFTNCSMTSVELEIRPKFSLRDHHAVNSPDIWDKISTETKIDGSTACFKRNDTGLSGFATISKGEIREDKIIFKNVFYPSDSMRGYDAMESLVSPYGIYFKLDDGDSAYILYSDEPIEDADKISNEIDKRYSKSTYPKDHPKTCKSKFSLEKVYFTDENIFAVKKYPNILSEMFNSFILKDDIIAGYPWFSAWGRDTMISMKALLYENKLNLYLKILDKYGKLLHKGMLPNVISEGGEGTNYNSIDASLWYAIRLHDCYHLIEDEKVKIKLFGYLTEIIGNYGFNKLLPFFTGEDGLLEIKLGDDALTWMDAKVYNKPVTPRHGKPVEINALWYNALNIFEKIAKEQNKKSFKLKYIKFKLKDITDFIHKIESSAHKFVLHNHLADRIENNSQIDEFRPNVLIAMSLPYQLWSLEVMENSWKLAHDELFTPYGIRTLTPRNSSFKKKFIGSHTQLDIAYHQGTVWAWLLGPFIESFYYINKKKMKKAEIKSAIEMFTDKFKQGILKGHIASVAEVWDGDNPHFPKGCPAQAWSVAALIIAEHIFDKIEVKK